jgi:hypothetical protein
LRVPTGFFLLGKYIGLWLEWIKDEVSLAISEEEKKLVLDLYEKAAADYLCMLVLPRSKQSVLVSACI